MLEELEELKDQKSAMESEAQQIESENRHRPNLKDKAIDQIKQSIKQTEIQIFKVESKKQELAQDIARVKMGLNTLFSLLHSPLGKGEEEIETIDDNNIENCLGKIEKKINLVMKMVKEAGLQELLVENVSDAPVKQQSAKNQMKEFEEFMSKNDKAAKDLRPKTTAGLKTCWAGERLSRSRSGRKLASSSTK